MDCFFKPQSIAVIGATTNPFKGGNAILKNLITGYRGKIYPINPRYDEIEELLCYPSVSAIPGPVDLAIVFVPARQVPDTVAQCADKVIPGVIIESGGFAETGEDGKTLQSSLIDLSKTTGIRLWGPNCMGLVDAVNGHVFSFMDPRAFKAGLIPGSVSLVVQSGMLSAGFLVDIMTHGIMGISKVCSVGNKIDVDECDLLPWLIEDKDTAVIGLYLESLLNGRRFIDICRSSPKPIVVLKGGKSAKGAQAAMSHTASLAGNERITQGAFAQAGVVEASDFKQMMDLCRTMSMVPPRREVHPGRVAILTFSGGAGIVSADFLAAEGMEVADLSEQTKESLGRLFPEWMPVSNPVDLWPALERHAGGKVDVIGQALRVVLADSQVDAVFLHAFVGNFRILFDINNLAQQITTAGKPAFIWLLGKREEAFQFYNEARGLGIPVFSEIDRAIECMAAVFKKREY